MDKATQKAKPDTVTRTVNPATHGKFRGTYSTEEYKAAVRAAYRLGVMDGEKKRQKIILVMQAANEHLVEGLARLDREQPLDGLMLSRVVAEGMLKAMQKAKNAHYAGILRDGLIAAGYDVKSIMSRWPM